MNYFPFLCMGNTEIANLNRSLSYMESIGGGKFFPSSTCGCPALEEAYDSYTTPEADDAPWYDIARPDSADFLGVIPSDLRVLSVASRDVNNRAGEGGVVGRLGTSARTVQVRATMAAMSPMAMAYGEEWLVEALAGNYGDGNCAGDTLTLLPACPGDLVGSDADSAFRYLYKAGIIDGPTYSPIQQLPECFIQQVSFQLAAGVPYLYGPTTTCLDEEVMHGGADEACCMVETNTWPGWASTKMTVTALDGPVTDITIQAHISTDGQCPESDGMPFWKVEVPLLIEEQRLIIDSIRRDVMVWDPASKRYVGGLPLLQPDGMFRWLDIPPCTDMCICISRTSGSGGEDLSVKIESATRNL